AQGGADAGPQGSLGGRAGDDARPGAAGRPARSFQEAESAVVKIVATGTFASLEAGRTVYNGEWIGSGFLIDPSGLAVTNNHVVAGAATLKVFIGGEVNKEFPARVVAASECMDLAVIQIEGGPFPVYLEWYSGPVNVGMDVYAAGYPGVGDHWQYTLTKGIISKTHEVGDMTWASLEYVYLHDARIRGGNSGGPLITPDGKVVGVNYAGENVQDVNLAIPVELARPVVQQLSQGQPYRWLGLNGEALVTEDGAFSGIWVASVESGSPADRVGIQPGDIIVEIENIVVAVNGTMKEYCEILASRAPHDPIKVKVLRLETGEVLVGTLNTDQKLSVDFTLDLGGGAPSDGQNPGGGAPSGGAPATGDDYVILTDDTQAIGVKVPPAWANQVDGSLWRTTWTKGDGSSYEVVAASVVAAPDLTAFNNLNGPGVWVAASRDFGRIGGYAQLLEGTQSWFTSCTLSDSGDYDDTLYEGAYHLWERCGDTGRIASVVVAARPKQNPTAFLVLVIVNVDPTASDAVDVVSLILDSFEVIGSLP
ncbi:MAG: serine protease, partial [Chloroflexi bacterium]|nr:serine protease [Chloroflexota bacterium]